MGLRVNTNMEAINAHNNLINTNSKIAQSLQRLSSGLRINSAKDDAAGYAIANNFAAKIASMKVASQNATEAQSMLQVADGAYSKINDILTRMKSLATQAASGQTDDSMMTTEFTALQGEIDRIANSTFYGDKKLVAGGLSGAGVTFQVGATANSDNQINISLDLALTTALGVDSGSINVGDTASAQAAMDAIDAALTSINSYMGSVGAYQNRLQYTIENLATGIENYSSSESAIRDVDMADEISEFTKNQILQQSGMAMLAQANSAPQQILTLLK
jgi:flagellin